MKNKYLYIIAALGIFYFLKKKKYIGENFDNEVMKLTTDEVDNLDFKIDYRDFGEIYKEQEKR